MANFTGYYSGLKEGLEVQSTIEARRETTRLQQLQRQQAEKQMAEEERTKQILSNVYSSQVPIKLGDDYEDTLNQLANQSTQAGQALMQVNPKEGINFMKQAYEQRVQAQDAAKRSYERKKTQVEMAGNIASQVTDQASLDEAIGQLSEVGVQVPDRVKVWSPATKEWFGRRAIASEAYLKSIELDQKANQIKINQEEASSKQADRLAKQKAAETKELRAQQKIASAKQSYKPSKEETKLVNQEIDVLAETDDRFDSLDSDVQKIAGRDVRYLKTAFMSSDPTLSEDQALQRARRTVLGRIKEDGTYPVVEETTKAAPTSAPPMEAWVAANLKANKGYTEAEIRAIYKDKFGTK